jgi:recombinational DNA repair protein (RecF pathway)
VCGKRQIVPEQAIQIMIQANLRPLEDFPGGKEPWSCECLLCGKNVSPKYTDIQSGYGGCKYCGGNYVEPASAIKVMELNGLIPQTSYKNASEKWHCKCAQCGRDVFPRYASVMSNGSGCAYCARIKVDPIEAQHLMESVGVIPLIPYPGARIGWHSKCKKCNLDVFPIYSNVKHQNANPCVYCAGKQVDKDSAFAIMVSANLSPLESYQRADKPWRCTCNKCGRLVKPTYTSIRIGQGGCKFCAEKGLDYTAPTFLYLMKHMNHRSLKIGIGNNKTRLNRISEHEKNGWELLERMDFLTGEQAYQVEQEVLAWIRLTCGLKPFLSPKEMPQRGWTETFSDSGITTEEVWKKVHSVTQSIEDKDWN